MVHVLHQTTVPTSDLHCTYIGPLKETTTHLSVFPNKDTPCSRDNEGTQERSHDVPDVVDKKRDCFLVCFVQNITYLVGMSDVTTVSNDRGNILQISCKNIAEKKRVSLCSANAWTGTHATFPVIPKQCCRSKFSVRVCNTSDVHTGQTFAINWSKIQLSWVLMLYYPYKTMFSAYKSMIVSPCACDLFVSKVTKISRYMDVRFWGHFSALFQCVMTVSWNQPQPGCWNYLYYIVIHSSTQHFK